jgi:hypothetical protein
MSKNNGLLSTHLWLTNLAVATFTLLLLKFVLPGNVGQGSLVGQVLVDIAAQYAHIIAFVWFIPSLVSLLKPTPTTKPTVSTSQ